MDAVPRDSRASGWSSYELLYLEATAVLMIEVPIIAVLILIMVLSGAEQDPLLNSLLIVALVICPMLLISFLLAGTRRARYRWNRYTIALEQAVAAIRGMLGRDNRAYAVTKVDLRWLARRGGWRAVPLAILMARLWKNTVLELDSGAWMIIVVERPVKGGKGVRVIIWPVGRKEASPLTGLETALDRALLPGDAGTHPAND